MNFNGKTVLITGSGIGRAAAIMFAPNDIANAIVWLCAAETGFITGHSMPVDGGMTA